MATGKLINPDRTTKTPLGIKSPRKHHVVTHNPSGANPGETLYVRIPKLNTNTFYVPNSVYLSVDIDITGKSGHKNHVVANLGRNLITDLSIKFGSEIIQNISNYDTYMTYKDLWLSKAKRDNMIFEGIQSPEISKLRSGHTASPVVANDTTLSEVFDKKYKIPLDFELLTDHAPLYKIAIEEDIIFEITLAANKEVLVSADTTDWGYVLKNICLEYDTVTDEGIAKTITQMYTNGYGILYDKVDRFKSVKVAQNDSLINENINFPRRSIKGVLLLFLKKFAPGVRKTEDFHNPEIKDVEITIEGMSNQLFNRPMRMLDQWNEAKKFFMSEDIKKDEDCFMDIVKYYGSKNHYGLWIDFRTTEDNSIHGSGTKLQNTKDGIQLSIKKKTGEGPYTMLIYIISDAQIQIQNCQLRSVMY